MAISLRRIGQQVAVRDKYPADDRSNDADISLVRAANVEVVRARFAVQSLFCRTINGAIVMPGVPFDGKWREHVGINDVLSTIRNES